MFCGIHRFREPSRGRPAAALLASASAAVLCSRNTCSRVEPFTFQGSHSSFAMLHSGYSLLCLQAAVLKTC
jgi:hypothetical protein